MTASGPFALGPALAGSTTSRRSNNAAAPVPGSRSVIPGSTLSRIGSIKKEDGLDKGKEKAKAVETEEEAYSDPDEGVDIVDIADVRQMDWMAPESLKKEVPRIKRLKKEESGTIPSFHANAYIYRVADDVNAANALDLSESEEEEEMENLMQNFMPQYGADGAVS